MFEHARHFICEGCQYFRISRKIKIASWQSSRTDPDDDVVDVDDVDDVTSFSALDVVEIKIASSLPLRRNCNLVFGNLGNSVGRGI